MSLIKKLENTQNKANMKGMTLVSGMIAVLISVIVGAAVVIPVLINVTAGITGTTGTILGFLPLMIGVVLIVAIVSLIRA